jgi:hypothetical protein
MLPGPSLRGFGPGGNRAPVGAAARPPGRGQGHRMPALSSNSVTASIGLVEAPSQASSDATSDGRGNAWAASAGRAGPNPACRLRLVDVGASCKGGDPAAAAVGGRPAKFLSESSAGLLSARTCPGAARPDSSRVPAGRGGPAASGGGPAAVSAAPRLPAAAGPASRAARPLGPPRVPVPAPPLAPRGSGAITDRPAEAGFVGGADPAGPTRSHAAVSQPASQRMEEEPNPRLSARTPARRRPVKSRAVRSAWLRSRGL